MFSDTDKGERETGGSKKKEAKGGSQEEARGGGKEGEGGVRTQEEEEWYNK